MAKFGQIWSHWRGRSGIRAVTVASFNALKAFKAAVHLLATISNQFINVIVHCKILIANWCCCCRRLHGVAFTLEMRNRFRGLSCCRHRIPLTPLSVSVSLKIVVFVIVLQFRCTNSRYVNDIDTRIQDIHQSIFRILNVCQIRMK